MVVQLITTTVAYKLKTQMKRAHITKLNTEQFGIVTDKVKIAEEFAQYYEKLYK